MDGLSGTKLELSQSISGKTASLEVFALGGTGARQPTKTEQLNDDNSKEGTGMCARFIATRRFGKQLKSGLQQRIRHASRSS